MGRAEAVFARPASDRIGSALTGTHPHHGFHGADPHFAVPDLTGPSRAHDAVQHLVGVVVLDQHLDAHLRHEVDRVLSTPVNLGMPLLPAVTLNLAYRHPQDADLLEAGLDVLEGERLDDRSDQLHFLFRLYFVAHSIFRAVSAVRHWQTRMWKNRAGSCREIVTALRVLSLVNAGGFFLRTQTQPDRVLEYQGKEESDDARVEQHAERADRLALQLAPAAAVEQALRHSGHAVDGRALRGGN